MTNEEKVT